MINPGMDLLSALAAVVEDPAGGRGIPLPTPQVAPQAATAGGAPGGQWAPGQAPADPSGPASPAAQTGWRPPTGASPSIPTLAALSALVDANPASPAGPSAGRPNNASPPGNAPSPGHNGGPASPANGAGPVPNRAAPAGPAASPADQARGPHAQAAPGAPPAPIRPAPPRSGPGGPGGPGGNGPAPVRQLPLPPPGAGRAPAGPAGPGAAPPPPFRAQPNTPSPPPFRSATDAPTPPAGPSANTLVDYLHDTPADADSELKERAQNSLLEGLGARLYDPSLTEDAMNALVATHLEGFFTAESISFSLEDRERLAKEITDDLLRHGPIEPFLNDPGVNEIMVNGHKSIYIEHKGKLIQTKVQFRDEAQLRRVIERIVGRVGRRIDESSPMVDARLPDGSRVNAIIPPLAVDGPSLTIRKFTADGFTIDDLVRRRSLSAEVAGLLEVCVRGRLNILVSGGTGSGKTTLLNILSSFIPLDERIVTIEDAVELRLRQPHVIRLESRPANVEGKGAVHIRDLVRNSLRMRPDRVVIGECRGGETLDMLQAMNTGHDGSLSTLHANTPRDALSRIETMVLMAGMDLPVRAIREQVASAVDMIVQIARLRDGSRRVTHITELTGMEGDTITMNDVFTLGEYGEVDADGLFTGVLKPTGIRPVFADRLAEHGIHVPEELFGDTFGLRLGKPAAGGW
ncbi:MAG: ATPase, T2SS/T4P/T4SS family [Acidimicrobiales bacterium]